MLLLASLRVVLLFSSQTAVIGEREPRFSVSRVCLGGVHTLIDMFPESFNCHNVTKSDILFPFYGRRQTGTGR